MPLHPARPSPRRYKLDLGKKFLALSSLMLLIAVGNIFTFYQTLQDINGVAETVNVAGRLRMLSQKIAFEKVYALKEPDREREELMMALNEYESALSTLEQGGIVFGYKVRPISPQMRSLAESIRSDWTSYRKHIEATPRGAALTDAVIRQIAAESIKLLHHAEALTHALTLRAQEDQKRMLARVYALFAAEALVLGIIFLGVRRRIILPLRILTQQTRRLAEGNYDYQIEFSSRDEIGELVNASNFASRQIARLIAQVEQDREDIRQAESMFRGLAENSIAGVYITLDARFVFVNPRMAEIFSYDHHRMMASVGLFDIFMEDDHAIVAESIRRRLENEADSVIYEARGRKSDGTIIHLEIFGSKMELQGRTAMIGMMLDVSSRRTTQQRLEYLATHDALTGLANRSLLRDSLGSAIALAQRSRRYVAVLLHDLDRFKVINDSLGHEAGDALLRAVAERLVASVRASDTVARLGGDEFVILMPDVAHAEDAAVVARKILAALSHPFTIGHQHVYTSASIGISLYPQDGDQDHLLKNADLAMYRAKQRGRNSFAFYSLEMTSHSQQRFAMELELRHAIERDELALAYQPKLCLHSGRVVGVEALLRWRHPEHGNISPAEFIPLAEETGLILAIGEWALLTACTQNRVWHDEGLPPLRIAVNISARQFHNHDLVGQVKSVLDATGLPSTWLELELTESTIMQDIDRTRVLLSELKQMGVKLALDDFGTGYSSLNYLRLFPFDSLKLDRAFIQDAVAGGNSGAIIRSVIALGHDLGLEIVAEGVETSDQFAFLQTHGCDVMQGYYFSRPLPPDRLKDLIQGRRA